MAQIETWLRQDIKQLVSVVPLRGNIFSGDNDGNLIGVEVFEDGQPYNMTGNCYGYVIKANNQTEFVPGTISGNKAQIVLPSICYNVVGPVSIVIKTGVTVTNNVPHGGVTIAACTSYVYRSQTDVVDDATNHILPSYNELADKLEDLEAKLIEAGRVNITQNKSGNVITVTTTDRNGTVVNKTLQEPTVSVTPNDGDFDLNVTDANGSQTVTIPNPNKELSDRAHVETVSRSKTRTGNPIQIEDAVNEIADKTVIRLVPKQDLHGFSRPWVGGAGKNKGYVPSSTYQGITVTETDGCAVVSGTATGNPTAIIIHRSPIKTSAEMTGVYTFTMEKISGSNPAFRVRYRLMNGDTIVSTSDYTSVSENATSFSMTIDLSQNQSTITNIFVQLIASTNVAFTNTPKYACMLRLASITDATWEPYENICPISGYDTVNVWDRNDRNLLEKYPINLTGNLIDTGFNTNSNYKHSDYIPVVPGEVFHFVLNYTGTSGHTRKIAAFDKDNNIIPGSVISNSGEVITYNDYEITYVVPDGAASVVVALPTTALTDKNYAYFGSVYPIAVSLATNGNQTAGTVYSGTVTLLADGSGTVVVDKKYVEFDGSSDEAWEWRTSELRAVIGAVSGIKGSANTRIEVMSNYGRFAASNNDPETLFAYSTGNLYYTPQRSITSAAELKTFLAANNLQIVYELATPVTYTLTANQVQTLLGYNYIYTDGAEIALTYRQESLATNETLLKLLPTGSASGNPVTFSDGADGVPLKQLVVNVEPKQEGSGTPSPTNIRPIRGWDSVPLLRTGKNLYDWKANIYTQNKEIFLPEGNYVLSCKTYSGTHTWYISGLKPNGEWCTKEELGVDAFSKSSATYADIYYGLISVNGLPFSSPVGGAKFKFGIADTDGTVPTQIEIGSTATAYEDPIAKTYDISIPSEAGTVYGGTITLDENGEGTLTVDREILDIASATWEKNTNDNYFRTTINNVRRGTAGQIDTDLISDRYTPDTPNNVAGGAVSLYNYKMAIGISNPLLMVRNPDCANVEAFKALGGTIIYPLATSITYSLTADQVKTLLGTNIISSDAGTVSVKYFKALGEEQDLSGYAKKNNPVFTGTNFKFGGNTFSASDMDVLRILIDEWLDATGGYPVEPADPNSGGNGGIEEYAPVEPGTGGGSGGSEVAEEPAEP